MTDEFKPRRATRSRVKLKLAVDGPSGSGKTKGALALATAIAQQMAIARGEPGTERVLGIDTENSTMELYADRYEFDHINLTAPYTSARYRQAMQVAISGGYDVLVVDSISHQWEGSGGIMTRKDALDAAGGNGFSNWSKLSPEHTEFIEFIKSLDVHTICTMRSKMEYVLEDNDKGKKTPRKVGLAPIQRAGVDYEFSLVFDLQSDHMGIVSKDRTELFASGPPVDLLDPVTAGRIWEWLNSGEERAPEFVNEGDRMRLAGMMKERGINRDDFAAYVKELGYTSTLQVPRSRLYELTTWIERAKEPSQDEKLARQSMQALGMSTSDRALLIQKHRSNWKAINEELGGMADQPHDEEEGEFFFEDGAMQCVVKEAVRKEGANSREFMNVTVNGQVNGKRTLCCWHKSLFPALHDSKGQVCHMMVSTKNPDYPTIEDVSKVGDRLYVKGKLFTPVAEGENPDAEPVE